MEAWNDCKRILCIRPDNIGDLLMSTPAIAALKETFNAHVTVLTSSMAKSITPYIPLIDETLVYDVPWVKSSAQVRVEDFNEIINVLRRNEFDAAVIFSVFSQNPLPTAMIPYLAGIRKRLGYCRENPYQLLTHWAPDQEPYTFVHHQVRRDLDLVKTVGATTQNEQLRLSIRGDVSGTKEKLSRLGVDCQKPWILFHPGVSEEKRMFPIEKWIKTGRLLEELDCQILITGKNNESLLAQEIKDGIGASALNVAGKLSMQEFITLIAISSLVVSVNTATVHIASAVGTPIVVLYALTNPQHAPWQSKGAVLPFFVDEKLQSKNEILRFVNQSFFGGEKQIIEPLDIAEAVRKILVDKKLDPIPELITGNSYALRDQRGTVLDRAFYPVINR
jgi:lipopolysaccharide heptosyltransferase II